MSVLAKLHFFPGHGKCLEKNIKDMYKNILKPIALVSQKQKDRDMKSEEQDIKYEENKEITIMDFVKKNRDFSLIADNDMVAVCRQLKARCPNTWTSKFETRAIELNKKFMTLKMGNPARFIDTDINACEVKNDESEVERLMTTPSC